MGTKLDPRVTEQIREELLREMEMQEISKLPVVMRPEDIKDFTGYGTNKVYTLLQTGEIPSKKNGAQYRIPRLMFLKWWYKPDKPTFGSEAV